jgi:hypothetical protein
MKKQGILEIQNVYTANAFESGGRTFVGAGSETEGVVRLYPLDGGNTEALDQCPGGMMSLIPVPGRPETLVSIMGLFPPFIGAEAGIFLHHKSGDHWHTRKILDLPFAHRCEFLPTGEYPMLVAATVSRHKENPADWSQAGEILVVHMEGEDPDQWHTKVIYSELTRNHGMGRFMIDGEERLCVSGAAGIFALGPDPGGSWAMHRLLEREVSEFTFIDLDGDGRSELVTIEPFHGHRLNIYKRRDQEWDLISGQELSFGHGLSSGMFNGTPVIVAGNRSESLALEIYTLNGYGQDAVKKVYMEEGAGPTQTQVFSHKGRDYILSANQRKHEVALYSGSL